MAETINATCAICGKGYHMCISCKDQMSLNPWKRHTDTAEHFKIYQVIHGYSTGVYNKREAKAKLNRIDLSDLNSLRDGIQKTIKDIIGEQPVESKSVAKQEIIAEESPVVESIDVLSKDDEQEVVKKFEKPSKFLRDNSVN